MQPNQQDQNLQNTASTLNTNVPEYLHMDPIPDPAMQEQGRTKKKLRIIIVLLTIAVLALAGTLLAWYVNYNSPQEKLYRALEKNLQVSYVKREYVLKNTQPVRENDYQVETDLSDPLQPKTHLMYTDSKTSSNAKVTTYIGDKIILDQKEYFSKLTSVTPKEAAGSESLNQWTGVPLSTNSSYYFDGIDSLQGLNSIQGVVLTGNFSDKQRNELMKVIRANKVYSVTASDTKSQNGVQVSDYTVGIDLNKINDLNKKALDLIGASKSMTVAKNKSDNGELHISVDDASGKIVKILYTIKTDSTVTFEKSETISYPSTLSINKPAIVNKVTSINK